MKPFDTIFRARMNTLALYEMAEYEQKLIEPLIRAGAADFLETQLYIHGTDLRKLL